MTDEL